ncbi:hypothetical protein [Hymenobacter sp. BT730]|uniref:pirin family protein n=1 Tax=Hymenobacter sp. BT730 TaxID=3063332 RepID=UPI0026E0304C|nr:hypothetical protein [Hymenobacter sp. BT730]
MKRIPGKIFLSEQRGVVESPYFRRSSTFRFGQFQAEDKEAFGLLQALNEEVVGGGRQLILPVEEPIYVLVLPLTGTVNVAVASSAVPVEVGELLFSPVAAGSSLVFSNPYPTETIHFLQLWIRAALPEVSGPGRSFPFDLAGQVNTLVNVLPAIPSLPLPFNVSLGQFAGRSEAVSRMQSPQARFFAFVLAGAFEVEGRLLHQNDGLALWDTAEVELEALSHDAVVLILEMPA